MMSSSKRKICTIAKNNLSKESKKVKLDNIPDKTKMVGFTTDSFNETSYYFENGLRKVYPYYFTFKTFTKGRWVNQKLIDIFAKEFRALPILEYEKLIKAGHVTVNNSKVDIDYRLKNNDLLANHVHRHEVPVISDSIDIIYQDEHIVAVNKPASIPVHPCGRYRHNTVIFILAKEHSLTELKTIHRLDRLTSGLLLFGKTSQKARELESQIKERIVQKEYICRVEGNFPEGEVECSEPIKVMSQKIGVCRVSEDGKDCNTIFKKLHYNGRSSLVIARPKTGRMHQIRVHLQYLGFPILNDPLYNHLVFGPNKGKGGISHISDEELLSKLAFIHSAENWVHDDASIKISENNNSNNSLEDDEKTGKFSLENVVENKDENLGRGEGEDGSACVENFCRKNDESSFLSSGERKMEAASLEKSEKNEKNGEKDEEEIKDVERVRGENLGKKEESTSPTVKDLQIDPNCSECKINYRDPKPQDLVMYLHALSYKGPGWCYETNYPYWASEDWVEDSLTT